MKTFVEWVIVGILLGILWAAIYVTVSWPAGAM